MVPSRMACKVSRGLVRGVSGAACSEANAGAAAKDAINSAVVSFMVIPFNERICWGI